jgi:hypothetical protein
MTARSSIPPSPPRGERRGEESRKLATVLGQGPPADAGAGRRSQDSNGQGNLRSNSGSYSARNQESNGQSYVESNEDSDSGRNGQSDRWGNG